MRTVPGILAALALFLAAPSSGGAQAPVVHAVLFYSPTCPHCHKVINEDLPPLRQKYGERLVIVGVDVTTQAGQALYEAMAAYFALPEERLGVPALVVGTDVMVGSAEIPERFPGLIERGLAAGGIYWPPVEEIRQALAAEGMLAARPAAPAPPANPLAPSDTARPPAPAPASSRPPELEPPPAAAAAPAPRPSGTPRESPPAETAGEPTPPDSAPGAPAATGIGNVPTAGTIPSSEDPGAAVRFLRDPVGNGVAVAVLVVLLATLAWSVTVMLRPGSRVPALPGWLFPLLGVAGAGIAAYLSFVEISGAPAVCGPVGDCNAVQQSAWARLFGVLPVGVLGLAGYLGLLAAWAAGTWGAEGIRPRAWLWAWGMALVGTGFSAWLTFLEPFVIGATCAWCISSALVMALMLAGATARASAHAPG